MWTIVDIDLSDVPGATALMSDGLPVAGFLRGGLGTSYRLMVTPLGWLDITDLGPEDLLSVVVIGDQTYAGQGEAHISMAVQADGSCLVSGDGNELTVQLTPFPSVAESDLQVLSQAMQDKLVPYPDLPPDGRPFSAVGQVAVDMFGWSDNALDLGVVVYDWTTADFFRMDVFNYYRYTAVPGEPLSDAQIVNAIWTSDWPPYQPTDAAFMGSMMMTPCTSEQEVADQYVRVSGALTTMVDALKRLTAAAVCSMPRTSVVALPVLYSGQVDVSNLGLDAFATYFLEYPGNAGPPPTPLGMPLDEALATFLAPGSVATLKSFLSTTDSQEDALHYSNGILLEVAPAPEAVVWTNCTYITPLSDEATKTEYLFVPGSRFQFGESWQTTVDGKDVTVVQMTELPSQAALA